MKNIIFFLFITVSLSGCQTGHGKSKHPFMKLENDFNKSASYLDLKEKKVIDLEGGSSKLFEENFLKKGFKSADHLILDSHVIGLMKRPVSSAFRLLTITRDAAYDAITPDVFAFFDKAPVSPLSEGPAMDLNEWEQKLDRISGQRSSYGEIKFLLDGDQFFPRLKESIKQAKKSILFRTFIFDNDDFAVEIADLLKKKAKNENVDINLS